MTLGEILLGAVLVVIGVALLVAGYYLGIFFAIIAGALTVLGLAIFLVTFLFYVVWDYLQYRKRKK